MALMIRCCISGKLSPPGKRNVDGARWMVAHSGSLYSSASSLPVHSPKSHSSRPGSWMASSPKASAIGAAVSTVRSSGEQYSATTGIPASLSATSAACARPASARCRSGARPGSTLPVVGVCPCRTSRIVVTGA